MTEVEEVVETEAEEGVEVVVVIEGIMAGTEIGIGDKIGEDPGGIGGETGGTGQDTGTVTVTGRDVFHLPEHKDKEEVRTCVQSAYNTY